VILAYGAGSDKKLNIRGENLEGVISSREFVNWYNGLPDSKNHANKWFEKKTTEYTKMLRNAKTVVIIGQGNVAIDVARIITKPNSELSTYDLPEISLKSLKENSVKKVIVVGRRGPVQAAFTTKEFRELTKISSVSLEIAPEHMNFDDHSKADLEAQGRPRKRFIQAIEQSIKEKTSTKTEKSIVFDFFKAPISIQGEGHVKSVKFEETRFEHHKLVGTGEFVEIPCDAVIKCIGYQSLPIHGVPFENGVVKNDKGRVGDGVYVSGWLKRGPVGVIATNIIDARETVDEVILDLQGKMEEKSGNILPIFTKHNVHFVTFDQFKEIDKYEVEKGRSTGKIREKVISEDEMLQIAHKNK
jgi:adrenodoxin-NADP+ reductase